MTSLTLLGCTVCVGRSVTARLNLRLFKTPSIPTVFDYPPAILRQRPKAPLFRVPGKRVFDSRTSRNAIQDPIFNSYCDCCVKLA